MEKRSIKYYIISILSLGLIIVSSLNIQAQDNTLSRKEKKEGWELLFNGNDFTGWRGVNKKSFPSKGWRVKEGTITCTVESGGSIITLEKYGNFELEWDWKLVTPGANSGLKYFVNERKKDKGGYGFGVEYQMLDNPEHNRNSIGAAYDLYPAFPGTKPNKLGEWNHSRVVSLNGKVEHWLNGKKILEYDRFSDDFKQKVADSKFKNEKNFGRHDDGHILLQDHSSEVYFKNIKVRGL